MLKAMPAFQGRQGHFLSGLHISALVEGNGQILEDPLHRGKGEYIRKRLCLHGGEGLHRVGSERQVPVAAVVLGGAVIVN